MLPLKNPRITQIYGNINPKYSYSKGYHTGLDMVSDDKNIYNTAYGIVLRAMYAPGKGADPDGWGNYVIVRQIDGYDVIYAHLSKVFASLGKTVVPGDILGIMGATGQAGGIHLHYEVRKGPYQDKNDVNAATYLKIKNEVGPIQYKEDVNMTEVINTYTGNKYEAQLINGKTFVELRALCNDYEIPILSFDEATHTVIIGGGIKKKVDDFRKAQKDLMEEVK